MKKICIGAILLSMLTGCGAGLGSPIPGSLYSEVTVPREGVGGSSAMKTGTASCESILGLVAMGDCSLDAAKKNGNITTVQYADMKVKNILGIYAKYTTEVKGN